MAAAMMAILPAIQSLMNERVEVVSMSMPNIMMIGPANAVENRRLIRCLGSSLTSCPAIMYITPTMKEPKHT